MGTDMVNVEHGAVKVVAIGLHPGRYRGIDLAHLVIAALADSGGHLNRRYGLELHVLRVGVNAFHGFLDLHIYVGFLIIPVVEQRHTQAGVAVLDAQVGSLLHKNAP